MAALSVTISRTRSSASFVKNMSKARGVRKGREWRAVQDCVENMGDSVERLRQSVRELGRSGGPAGEDFVWHMSNVQTWVSAALTDDNTCLDGFGASASVKGGIKDRVLRVAQLTSNALAFVNRFASTHPTPQTP
uniref:21 kDa protein n=2 Tax=Cajanus cajan TaxID=3821 RepID=A0A151TJI4_CAJCA|nr:21 kDa protein [Cajanus cajan]